MQGGVLPDDFSLRSVDEEDDMEEKGQSDKIALDKQVPISESAVSQSDAQPILIRSVVREKGPDVPTDDAAAAPWMSDVLPTEPSSSVDITSEDDAEEERVPVRQAPLIHHAASKRVRDAAGERPARVSLLPRITRLIFVFILVAGVGAGGAVLAWVLPKATVTVSPHQETFSADLEAVLAASATERDPKTGTIPATPLSAEVTSARQIFPATGTSSAQGGKARGRVTITNAYTSNPQPLIATTRFLTAENKLFRLRESIVVPGMTKDKNGKDVPGKLAAEVEADLPGAVYNLSEASFTIPGLASDPRAKITARTVGPFTGGVDVGSGKKTVSQEDMDKAVAQMQDTAMTAAVEALKAKVAVGESVLPAAVKTEVLERRSAGDVGDAQDTFSLELQVSARTLAYKEEDLRVTLFDSMKALLPQGSAFTDQTMQGFTFKLLTYDTANESLRIQAHYERPVLTLLPESEISSALAGKSADEVQNVLMDRYQVASARVAFWPFWVEHVPRLPGKVRIVLDTDAESR